MLARLQWIALVVLLAWGAWGEWRVAGYEQRIAAAQLQAATDVAQRSERARETERIAARNNTRIADELLNAQKQRDAAARTAAQRLRDTAEARAAADATAAACQRHEAAPIDVIPPATRDALVELVTDADEVAGRLRACQAYLTDVVAR